MSHRRTTNRATRLFTILPLVTLLLSATGPLVHARGTWTKQAAIDPPPRVDHAMAYLGGDCVLLIGGADDSWNPDGDTWVYGLSDNPWTNQSPATAPSAPWGHAMAHLGGDQVLLFIYSETWVYDLSDNTWTNQTPTAAPSARVDHAMAYLGGDQVLLFGGQGGGILGDTWVYDLSDNTWTNQSPTVAPSARLYHAMAHLGGDQVLLFGGWDDGLNYDGETWVYDLSDNTWTNQAPTTGPSARRSHTMASLGGDQVLLFGGYATDDVNGETWVYDLSDNTWTNQSPTAAPSERLHHAMAHLAGAQVLLFGGWVDGLN